MRVPADYVDVEQDSSDEGQSDLGVSEDVDLSETESVESSLSGVRGGVQQQEKQEERVAMSDEDEWVTDDDGDELDVDIDGETEYV